MGATTIIDPADDGSSSTESDHIDRDEEAFPIENLPPSVQE